ncbi:hypothetical protein [Rhizobium sp. SG570]|nr:hypothetical protein [Rhizobium sp. SG570]NKJ40264.1 hypothetical protein [Rhizobium sp. SG570]
MTETYSLDLPECIASFVDNGQSRHAVAAHFSAALDRGPKSAI